MKKVCGADRHEVGRPLNNCTENSNGGALDFSGVFGIVTGEHTNEIARSQCSWNVFRVRKSTAMEANAIADTLAFRPSGNPLPASMSGSAPAHSDPGRQKRPGSN
jgi:hypothetical protein